MAATSSGEAERPSAVMRSISSTKSREPDTMGVSTMPGWMALTRMFHGASSMAALLVSPRRPHFDAL